jgi:Flp pilus assembly protein TadG
MTVGHHSKEQVGTGPATRQRTGFGRDRHGSVAVEFGILILPFVLILFFIIDVAMMFFADAILDRSLHKIAREIKTGQATSSSMTADQFKTKLCSAALGLFSCSTSVYLNVQIVSSISSVSFFSPINSDGTMKSTFGFQIGTAGDYMLVQGFLKWKSPVAYLTHFNGVLSDGSVLLSSAVLFRNEPYN